MPPKMYQLQYTATCIIFALLYPCITMQFTYMIDIMIHNNYLLQNLLYEHFQFLEIGVLVCHNGVSLEAVMKVFCPAVLIFTHVFCTCYHVLLDGHERVWVTNGNNQTLGSGDGCVEDNWTAQTLGWVIWTS